MEPLEVWVPAAGPVRREAGMVVMGGESGEVQGDEGTRRQLLDDAEEVEATRLSAWRGERRVWGKSSWARSSSICTPAMMTLENTSISCTCMSSMSSGRMGRKRDDSASRQSQPLLSARRKG